MGKCELNILDFWLNYIGYCGLGDSFGYGSAKLGGGPNNLVGRKCTWEIVRETSSEVEFNACLNE